MMWPMMHGYNGTSWWWLGMVFNLLFWAIIIYAGYRLFRGITLGGAKDDQRFHFINGESAEEILRQRYARGEIDREKFREMLEELKK